MKKYTLIPRGYVTKLNLNFNTSFLMENLPWGTLEDDIDTVSLISNEKRLPRAVLIY